MKFKIQIIILSLFVLLNAPIISLAQIITFGTATSFCILTTSGAIANIGNSIINGDIGSNAGSVAGFENSSNYGTVHNADAVSNQASIDLQNANNQLMAIAPTNTTHAATFGNGEPPLSPGVYSIAGEGTIAGSLTLDGKGNVNSVFIFKIGGALSTSTNSAIVFINGASACNLYWVAEGAIALGAAATMKGTFIAHGANSLGVNSTLDGRLFSTGGAIDISSVEVNLPYDIWLGGINSDWNTAGNWLNANIPTSSTNIIISANTTFSPIVNSGIGKVQNIVIQSGASLTVTGAILQIAGTITNTGTFDATHGTIEMNGSSAQIIPANTFVNNNLQNLIISNNVTLEGQQNLTGTLSFGSSNVTLSTGDFLTLKSTASGTARVTDITNGNLLKGTAINGKVTIERYFSAKRAWRLLSSPISSIGAPTINASWQEGVGGNSASNPYPGYGTHITGGSIANGFDQGINNNASIKIYNNATNTLTGLSVSSNTNSPITTYPAYFLFLRGNRATQLSLGSSAPLSATTLRIKGQINTGNIPVNINVSNTTLVGNPYPSAIDFHALMKSNVNDMFYVWDPKLNGSSGVGGYVTFIGDGSGQYISTASVSPESQYIQSGEAFFVRSDGTHSGILTFTESAKTSSGSDALFKPLTDNTNKIRVNLLAMGIPGSDNLCDGIVTAYNDNNSNLVDNKDANKLFNVAENIAIGRQDINLAIESRKTIDSNDTTFINLYTLKKQNYKLQIFAEGMDKIGLHAFLKDQYLGVQKNIIINLAGTTEVVFTVNAEAASYAVNRFSIIFKQNLVLAPVVFSSVTAYQSLKHIIVKWAIEKEFKIKNYAVEISSDNIHFKTTDSLFANANNNTRQVYTWLDKYVLSGIHYYRIKSMNIFGKETYSPIVNVTIDKNVIATGIAVYGSIKNKKLIVQFNSIEKGMYSLQLFSMDGLLINKCIIEHTDPFVSSHHFATDNYLPPGKYILQLSGKTINFTTSFTL